MNARFPLDTELQRAAGSEPIPGTCIAGGGFTLVRLLDGFERTADHVSGRVADLIRAAGFDPVERGQERHTWLGTVGFFRAIKPSIQLTEG